MRQADSERGCTAETAGDGSFLWDELELSGTMAASMLVTAWLLNKPFVVVPFFIGQWLMSLFSLRSRTSATREKVLVEGAGHETK